MIFLSVGMTKGHRQISARTEVRRKKHLVNTSMETTFYVSNIPNDYRLAEIRSPFTKFGQVVDVFIPPKKNRNGKHFAFIRFNRVKDELALENALQGIKCNENVLKVNLGKHRRNSSKALTNATHKQHLQPQFQRHANTSGVFRDRRSFA
ncbi:unnamed protein product [Lactuca virosa]|uniref:RRM domain-containing protein n=1 Tax=Lactuca virosa TaxID=75947 RepID=A0AAU9MB84_9ASTR|nr:unnamed protein product [Lactuca virosa]